MHWPATRHMDVALRGLGWGRLLLTLLATRRSALPPSCPSDVHGCTNGAGAGAQERPPLSQGKGRNLRYWLTHTHTHTRAHAHTHTHTHTHTRTHTHSL